MACTARADARREDGAPVSNAPAVAAASAQSGCGPAVKAGLSEESLLSSGVKRTYRLFVPASYDTNSPTALVLNFHGFGGNARQQEANSHMTQEAERSGFITVSSDGTEDPQRWHIYGRREEGYAEDFQFVRDLVAHVSSRLCIDPARIYATGMSNGAGFSSLLACELNDVIAAIAPVAGSPFPGPLCRDKQPVPILAFHGTEDDLVPFDGGPSGRLGLPGRGVRENQRQWAEFNGCDLTLKSQRVAGDVVLESYGNCTNGADTQLYVIEGGGHSWPGASLPARFGASTRSIDATALIWQFFAAHSK
jgi:polyhydroxybutyrate depolymerase